MPEKEQDLFDRDADILPDALLDKHLDGGPDTAVADDPDKPEPEDILSGDDPEGTPAEGPEDDPEEEDVDEGGDEDPDEEEDDLDDDDEEEDIEDEEEDLDDDDEEEEEEDDDEEEDFLDDKITADDRKRIKDDPVLAKFYRQMQKGFHEKTTKLAEGERGVEQRESRMDEFEANFDDPKKAADYFGWLVGKTPSVAYATFEAVAEGEGGHDFLVAIGDSNPEMFEKAYERVQDLISDEAERGRYKRGQAQQEREAKLNRREQRIREQAFDRDYSKISTVFRREATRLDIAEEDLKAIETQMADRIRQRRREDGSIDLTPVEVKEVVREAKKAQDRIEKRVRRKLDLERVGESRKAVKKKAAKGKRKGPVSPKSSARRPVKEHKAFKPPENEDPMDAFVDFRVAELIGEK